MAAPTTGEPCLKGNLLFKGDDALLAIATLNRLQEIATKNGKTHRVTVADLMRDALRCLAEKHNISL